MRPCPRLFLSLLLAWMLPTPAVSAQPVTIYRCTDAAGTLTVQNTPCPAGSSQSERQLTGVASSPETATPATGAAAFPAAPPAGSAGQAQDVQRSSDGGFVTTSTGTGAGTSAGTRPPPVQYTADGGVITTSTGPEPRILDSANRPHAAEAAGESDPDRPPPPPIFRCATYDNDSYLSEEAEAPPRCLALRTVGLDGNPAAGAGRACEVVRDQCSRVADGAACEAWRRYAREAESRWRFAHPDNVERRHAEYERLANLVGESCGG